MRYLFMEANGATLPSGSVRDSFGIRSGFVRDLFGIRCVCFWLNLGYAFLIFSVIMQKAE